MPYKVLYKYTRNNSAKEPRIIVFDAQTQIPEVEIKVKEFTTAHQAQRFFKRLYRLFDLSRTHDIIMRRLPHAAIIYLTDYRGRVVNKWEALEVNFHFYSPSYEKEKIK